MEYDSDISLKSPPLSFPKKSQKTLICQFRSEAGELTGPELDIPANIKISELEILINHLLKNVRQILPYFHLI